MCIPRPPIADYRSVTNEFNWIIFQELQESFNYGLFMPPSNGKAGKFLDEERRLSEYPFSGPIGYLEVSPIELFQGSL